MVTIASNLNSRLTLNDGVQMPMYGLGMHMSRSGSEEQVEAAVVQALQYGYRLVDTAEFYGNEEDIGRGIRNSGVHRDDIFVSTKVWDHGYDTCKEHFHESLKKLGLDYLDLYLIHAPIGGQNIETYKAMMELKQQGLIRSVGVCNFGVHHMEGLMEANMPTPAVCQVELHPWQQKRDIVNYCRDHKIAMMGYAPLTQGKMLNDPSLLKIADKYGKSGAMVLLRWSVQHGFITIPKSSNPQRMHDNKTVFDWSLKQDDMEALVTQVCLFTPRNPLVTVQTYADFVVLPHSNFMPQTQELILRRYIRTNFQNGLARGIHVSVHGWDDVIRHVTKKVPNHNLEIYLLLM